MSTPCTLCRDSAAREWLTTDEVAATIRVHRDYVARQCSSGALRAKKLGTEWRIHRDAVEAFMRGPPSPPTTRSCPRAR